MKIFIKIYKKIGSLNQFKKRIKLGGIIHPYKGVYSTIVKKIVLV